MPQDQNQSLTQLELAEVEAASDVLDADLEGHRSSELPAATASPQAMPAGPAPTETDLAQAEAASDVTHTDPA
jgi:hypothetical protein